MYTRRELCLTCVLSSIANPHDVPVWNEMASIKSDILKRWDSAPMGVRICAIKFVQKIVQVQTPGAIPDPRVCNRLQNGSLGISTDTKIQRPEQNEISLSIVSRDHPMIPPSKLEPEASGLLDRLLNVFQESTRYLPISVVVELVPDAMFAVMPS